MRKKDPYITVFEQYTTAELEEKLISTGRKMGSTGLCTRILTELFYRNNVQETTPTQPTTKLVNMATKLTPTQFIAAYKDATIAACKGQNIFPSVKLAQMALESGWGERVKGNNFFGIKNSKGWKGKVISFTTREVINKVSKIFVGTGKIYANSEEALASGADKQTLFRYYDNVIDSIKDHTKFLQANIRYFQGGVFAALTPQAQCEALQRCGYATDPEYASVLKSIISHNHFEVLDSQLN